MMKLGVATSTTVAAAYGGIELGPYPGYEGSLKVQGKVNAYLAESGNAYVTYEMRGLEKACETTPEGVANACGIHIHEGKTCSDASAVGGHYYATDSDPWGALGYNSKFGYARGSVKAAIGTGEDISGRAIVVHDSTGGRVACAQLPSKLETRDAPTVNIVELAQSVDSLSTLVAAVVAGDLADTLSSPGPFTVFAPTNDAFGALPEGTLDTLLKPENKDQLVDILTYHVLPAQVLSTDLKVYQQVATVEGKKLQVLALPLGDKTLVRVGSKLEATVAAADNLATNGVAHIIDTVMLPPSHELSAEPTLNIVELAQSVDSLSTLVAAVVAGDLAETLSSPGPFTVFAPTNDAFGALPEGTLDSLLKPENKDQLVDILTYHVLPAQVLSTDLKFFQSVGTVEGKNVHVIKTKSGVYVGPSTKELKKVIGADNLATNGVAHIIDGVLLPPAGLSDVKPNIVELAQSVDDLSTLVAAVVAGDLVETLSSPGPFTVFAPTNEAFGALPAGTLDSLLKPENKDQLVDILTYHVLPAQVLSTDLKFFQSVATVEGKNVHVIKSKSGVYVGPSTKELKKVVGADNLASNGVAHIIDGVLLPPAGLSDAKPNIVELAQSVDDLSTLVAAVVAGDLVETLSSPGPFTVFAPTNEAFGALPAGTLDSLLKPENKDQLVDILTYHVLPAQVLSTDLKPKQVVKTVEGKELLVSIYKGDVYANKAKVVGADNLASNGVAHIIDGVLLPKADDVIV